MPQSDVLNRTLQISQQIDATSSQNAESLTISHRICGRDWDKG
jgi:hypothetical protein